MKNFRAGAFTVAAFLLIASGNVEFATSAVNPCANTFCNPVNVSYNFWPQAGSTPPSYREAADPDMLVYKNTYYLFASHSAGYWWSTDMLHWTFVTPTGLDVSSYAPAVEVSGDSVYYTAGTNTIYKTTDLKGGAWTVAGSPRGFSDPCLFRDDDGKWYCSLNCSPNGTIDVIQLDPTSKFAVVGKEDTCIISDRNDHGFEVAGDYNENPTADSWIEGSWITKYNGKYYLQYAVPGTQYRSYADGCYMASSPTGPYTFCQNSPISMKPAGFVTGTGHSSTFKDLNGKYWHITTVVVSVLAGFERRVAIFPAGFDTAGSLHTDTYLGDYPQYIPGKASTDSSSNRAGVMLLSFKKTAIASSTLSGHPASDAFDENIKTWWSATSSNSGEWLCVDLGKACDVGAIQTNFAEQDITYAGGRGTSFSHKYKIEGATDTTGTWMMLVDKSANTTDVPHDYTVFDSLVSVRYLRITNEGPMPAGGKFAVRDFRVFGNAHCTAPTALSAFTVSRSATDQRMATLSWSSVANADGYIVRLGNAADKLYNNYQVLSKDSTSIVIRSLNKGVPYFFTIDTYSSCGITKGVLIKRDNNTTAVDIPEYSQASRQSVLNGTFTIAGAGFVVPAELRGKSFTASVYDLAGRFLYGMNVKNGIPQNLASARRAEGIAIVRVKMLGE